MNQHRPKRKPYAASIAVLAALAACLFAVPLTAIAAERYDVERVGMPQIGASYQRPEMKTYSLEQLRSEFGPKAGSTRPGVRFSDTWTPTPA